MPRRLFPSMQKPSLLIFWHRRDLRLTDNAGLYHALRAGIPVLPLFIFDTNILESLERNDARVEFIHREINRLAQQYAQYGASLRVETGSPEAVFTRLLQDYHVKAVLTNRDYEPYALLRDKAVEALLKPEGIPFHTFKDHVIFEGGEVVKSDGSPYTVFTPYMRRWKEKLNDFYTRSYPVEKYLSGLFTTSPFACPSLVSLGFTSSGRTFPSAEIDRETIRNYHLTRDIPSVQGTSRLSVHLRFGTVSVRKLLREALVLNEKWLNELIWREFYQAILFHFPHTVTHSFKPAYDRIPWQNDPSLFARWCEGKTGYPIVDAGMRELNATGYMHNRVRMVTASFLVKHLLIDWRWGEAYFARKLLDFELASNVGGWQWAAGSGCDAAPYFRVFNPGLQAQKFDPEQRYIRHWLPEFGTADYPLPIVDHRKSRERVLGVFRQALGG